MQERNAGAAPSVTPSPSQRAPGPLRQRLESEREVVWRNPSDQSLPWLREVFVSRRPTGHNCRAYTVDGRGRVVRAFLISQRSSEAYARLLRDGYGTCPIEAIRPATIVPGRPAEPAHPYLLPDLGWGERMKRLHRSPGAGQ